MKDMTTKDRGDRAYNAALLRSGSTTVAVRARDAALDRVKEKAGRWFARAMMVVQDLPQDEYIGEDIRGIVHNKIGEPHHHNAYGSLIMNAVREGLLVRTKKEGRMKDKRSHARATPTYRRP